MPGIGQHRRDRAALDDLAGIEDRDIVGDRADRARQVSPLHNITKDDPPFLIIHGDQDDQVPLVQSERLHARLREVGVPSEFHVVAGAGHGGKAFDTPEVRARIRAFLTRSLPAPTR